MKGLHITDALGLLAYFFCGYAALLVMWTVWKKERPKHAERWMKFLLTARTKKDKFDDGMARWWPLWFCVLLAGGTAYGMLSLINAPVEEHHVAVYGQLDNGDWAMSSDEEGKFAYRPCPDFDAAPMLKKGIGFVAPRAAWDQLPTCRSIRKRGRGFFWRDQNWHYIHIKEY
jgi:hypothetical protein